MGIRKTTRNAGHKNEQLSLRRGLKAEPRHHWLLTRVSSVYYEQKRYALALKYAEKAFAEAPSCPLVLWDYAGALQMRGRHHEALDLYARIVTRGVKRIASGECGEGKAWARGLVADSHYRASLSLKVTGNDEASLSAFEQKSVAWIIKAGQSGCDYHWQAVESLDTLAPGRYCLWHKTAGHLTIPSGH